MSKPETSPGYTTDQELVDALKEPFFPWEIEWRVNQAGKGSDGKMYASLFAYINARAVYERLDEVCGPGGWWNEQPGYSASGKGVNQGITINLPQSGKVTKWDGAEETNVEAVKGGLSNAMKRAAVLWGIGRYLYQLDIAYVTPQKDKPQDMKDWIRTQVKIEGRKEWVYFKRPTLPKWALPKEAGNEPSVS